MSLFAAGKRHNYANAKFRELLETLHAINQKEDYSPSTQIIVDNMLQNMALPARDPFSTFLFLQMLVLPYAHPETKTFDSERFKKEAEHLKTQTIQELLKNKNITDAQIQSNQATPVPESMEKVMVRYFDLFIRVYT